MTPARSASTAQIRQAALRGASAMALALFGNAGPAVAQGFNGTMDPSTTGAFLGAAGEVIVTAPEAIVNWSAPAASAGATNVDFLSAGNTATFQDEGGSGFSGPYTVLNRVIPSFGGAPVAATISLSGTVNSNVSGAAGGNIWFYSPYGIIANAGSSFDVGSLLLTTSDIQLGVNGSLYQNGNQIAFQQASQAGSFVQINPGAFLHAGNGTSSAYIGVFSPRIVQQGVVRSDGQVAFVAAEQGAITFDAGLIDIAVTTGTGDPDGIVHTGSTGGQASVGEARTLAMVAMSKNQALTMLLSGSMGYDAAAAGVTDGGAVVLYSGNTLEADAVRPDPARLVLAGPANASTGGISIAQTVLGGQTFGSAQFGNSLQAFATGTIDVRPVFGGVNSPGDVTFGQNAGLVAGGTINLAAEASETITAQDSLFLSPLLRMRGEDVNITVSGDPVNPVPPGAIRVTNVLSIDASGRPDFNNVNVPLTGRTGQGGNVIVSVQQGVLSAGQGLTVDATGVGEDGLQAGGEGRGGTVDIGVGLAGTITAPVFNLFAGGQGGNTFGSTSLSGGDGSGGSIALHDDGGTLAAGDVLAIAQALGGTGGTTAGGATGGLVDLRITGQTQTWQSLFASASAEGGTLQVDTSVVRNVLSQNNGVHLAISGSGALNASSVTLENGAFTNAGSSVAHSAQAGGADLQVSNGGSLVVTGAVSVRADVGLPGDPFIGNVVVAPAMTAGAATVGADNGAITAGSITISASASGVSAQTTGAQARGGTAILSSANGATITLTGPSPVSVLAEARGDAGPAPLSAQGGTARITADNGTITTPGNLVVSASALRNASPFSSEAGNGFNARGGSAALEVLTGTGSISAADALVYAKGEATLARNGVSTGFSDIADFTATSIIGLDGNGGIGTGGAATVSVFGGTLNLSRLLVRAYGLGGASGASDGAVAWQSGRGAGGTAALFQTGGAATVGTLDVVASGFGGGFVGADAPTRRASNGGDGSGGFARVNLSGGTLTLAAPLAISSDGIGGVGMDTSGALGAGNGGAGVDQGGLAELVMPAGSTASLVVPALRVSAIATGGAGGTAQVSATGAAGNGGGATASTARINLADGAIQVAGGVIVTADAIGGAGLAGGGAIGGSAAFALVDTLATPATTRQLGALTLTAGATGGAGATAPQNGFATAGATGLDARAGRAASALVIAADLSATTTALFGPLGDGFTGTFGAIPVTVQGNALISTLRDISGTVQAGGGLAVTGTLDLIGRAIAIGGPGGLTAGGNVQVLARDSIALGGLSSGGTTLLEAFDVASGAFGPVSVGQLASTGLVTARTGSFQAVSPGALSFADSFATAGDFTVQAAGNLNLATLTVQGLASLSSTGGNLVLAGPLQGGSVALNAGQNIGINAALTSTGALGATAGGFITAAAGVSSGGNASIDGASGINLPSLTSGGTTLLRSVNGAIIVGQLTSAGPVSVFGRSANVSSPGALTFANATTTAGDLAVTTTGNATLASVDATGAVTLTSLGGTINAPALNATGPVTAQGRAVTIGSTGSLTFASSAATAGDFSATAGGSLTFAGLAATGAFNAQAGTFAAFNGAARGSTVSVSSGDIRIGATGSLGQRGLTTSLTLTNTAPGAGTAIGGTGAATGWSLDAAEALRLFADQAISIVVPGGSTNPADVSIGALGISYGAPSAVGPGANIGAGGTFAVSTPGRIRVTGAVAPVSVGAGDIFSLTGGTFIDVVTDTGSIALKNANGGLSGTLRLTAPTVRVATAAGFGALDGTASLLAASTQMDQNDGHVDTAGALQASALQFTVGASTLYIQNSGIDALFANRRGFTANSLVINGLAGAQPSFAINGVLIGPGGQAITGADTFGAITVNGTAAAAGGAFNQLSTVNGCQITRSCLIPPGQIAPPLQSLVPLTGLIDPGSDGKLTLPVVQFGETPLLDSPPLIDEPVTGIGNDDLWRGRCAPDKDCAE